MRADDASARFHFFLRATHYYIYAGGPMYLPAGRDPTPAPPLRWEGSACRECVTDFIPLP